MLNLLSSSEKKHKEHNPATNEYIKPNPIFNREIKQQKVENTQSKQLFVLDKRNSIIIDKINIGNHYKI